jgi:hypothetical protein
VNQRLILDTGKAQRPRRIKAHRFKVASHDFQGSHAAFSMEDRNRSRSARPCPAPKGRDEKHSSDFPASLPRWLMHRARRLAARHLQANTGQPCSDRVQNRTHYPCRQHCPSHGPHQKPGSPRNRPRPGDDLLQPRLLVMAGGPEGRVGEKQDPLVMVTGLPGGKLSIGWISMGSRPERSGLFRHLLRARCCD